MKYRRLTESGDYSFGSADQDFVYNLEACAQAIKTRLDLLLDTFWRDLSDGLPLFQRILGASGSESNLLAVDNIIQQRIRGTQGVTDIVSYSSTFNRDTRVYQFQATVQTEWSTTVIEGSI